ncbi:MAG: lipid-A-disaccharide synthase [Alphaproteobacteria bacterium]|nr:lipid-A-disaccharide synthase [Alphaproteobacteria bacterium]NNF24828.1 lipid-A-disaccharide synthase [Paracoccaceae bacterium]
MKAFVIAGEPSGDRLGGALMAGLRKLAPDITFEGIGGPMMQAQGLESRFDMAELSVMGLAEVLPRFAHLKRRIRETSAAILEAAPDVVITIDSPDFCLRVLRRVRAASGVRTVHYVAPSVWAWRPHRAQRMAGLVDQVLTLLPFEPPYMEAAGLRADFVGHPVVAERQASAEEIAAFRKRHGIGDAPVILALPGSRSGEVQRLAPTFGEALRPVLAAHPEARVLVVAAAPVAAAVRDLTLTWPGDPIVIDPRGQTTEAAEAEKRAAFAAADVALAASGTVSLELAAAGTPMVIAYDMNWISRQLIKSMLKIDTVTLVNLVSETRVVPEFLGADCKPEKIAPALTALVDHPGAQSQALALTMERLGAGGKAPGLRAAEAVLDGLR